MSSAGGIDVLTVVFLVAAFLVGVVLHEVSHGVVALWFGDTTARDAGRLSLNPIRHVDPFGTVVLPGLLIALAVIGPGTGVVFGYAKPVPVRSDKLRRPEQMLWVGLAGPITNLLLALLCVTAVRVALETVGPALVVEPVLQFLVVWTGVNTLLCIFNLVPIPPLDGSEVVARVLPASARRQFRAAGQYGFLALFALVFLFPEAISAVLDPVLGALLRLAVP
jgi:Zn-dependent protease